MTSRIVSIDGRLFVEDPWETSSDGKEECQRLWPLAAASSENVGLVGQPAVYENGLFVVGTGMFKRRIPMQSGPSTKCSIMWRPVQVAKKRRK